MDGTTELDNRGVLDVLRSSSAHRQLLCVGLDPNIDLIPAHLHRASRGNTIVAFNEAIIEATSDLVVAYKPNLAYYERFGAEGIDALQETVAFIRSQSPESVVLLDAKRADIGSTNLGYVDALHGELDADAITINPYLGGEALEPFLSEASLLNFVLCRTSNPGAHEFQGLVMDGEPLYMHVARAVAERWNGLGNCGLVVGATSPSELEAVRRAAPSLPLLIPGVGAQGGDVEQVIAALESEPDPVALISVSRSVLYAADDEGFASSARDAVVDLNHQISESFGRGAFGAPTTT